MGEGSELGGVEFGVAADADHVYAAVSDIVARKDARPGLYALDPATGAVGWRRPNVVHPTCRWKGMWCNGALSQAISVMPGVVFAGASDGHFRAYDAADGHILWDIDTGRPDRGAGRQVGVRRRDGRGRTHDRRRHGLRPPAMRAAPGRRRGGTC